MWLAGTFLAMGSARVETAGAGGAGHVDRGRIRDTLASMVPRIMMAATLALLGASCGGDVDPTGDFSISVTNRENGCGFDNWTEGNTATGIPVTITEDGEVRAEVGGAAGVFLGVVLGSNIFTGSVDGDQLDLTLFGTTSATQGNCTYTINAVLDGTLDGDVLTGDIRYTAATNDNPDCSTIEGCVSRQQFNGTRPPQ